MSHRHSDTALPMPSQDPWVQQDLSCTTPSHSSTSQQGRSPQCPWSSSSCEHQPSGLTRPIGGTHRVLLISGFFTALESLAVQLGGLKAAVAMGPAELFLGLPSLGKAKRRSQPFGRG